MSLYDPLKTTWMRDALTWVTGKPEPETEKSESDDKGKLMWLWEAIQGDFNDERSTKQIAFDAAISFIPLVDQICDIRDLIANCRKIKQDPYDKWAWVALGLTLVGLFPSLGSVVKGVFKIIFVFVRKYGLDHVVFAVDKSMTWVITFLRKREVQKYLHAQLVDDAFGYMARQIRKVMAQVSESTLLALFTEANQVLRALVKKMEWWPRIAEKAKAALRTVEEVRHLADKHIADVVEPLQKILETIAGRLEAERLLQRAALHNTDNIHFRGTLPEVRAVTLMRTRPRPPWLNKGKKLEWAPLDPASNEIKKLIAKANADALDEAKREALRTGRSLADVPVHDWPKLADGNIASFHKMVHKTVHGPAKIYRVGSPSSGAMGDCWVSEEVFQRIVGSPDPKAAWRKFLAVWPDWNSNGEFFVYEVKAGEKLKIWEGPASSQLKDPKKYPDLDVHLEGGWNQIIFKAGDGNKVLADQTNMYKFGADGQHVGTPIPYMQFKDLPDAEKATYMQIRENIQDPHITGPFQTHWEMTDYDEQLQDVKIGLPALPGQVFNKPVSP